MPLLPTSARAIPEPGQITAVPEEAVAEPVRNIPAPGTFAPDFELMDGSGHAHRLSDYQGRRVVVYFYPKDDTPGCTTEACGFRDSHSDYASVNAAVLGISPDSVESHERFAQKFALPFPLLADPEHAVVEQYGAWGAKQMYGNATMGVLRSTFIIGPDGRIEHVFENVKADGHAAEVLEYLRQH
ncbi:MAG: thioredoxin-dependent thiol peroxidase [Phycisphaerae bacterium]|nr:thioredoxin-dependent thiol peroxidase [Phycisphaerae bacterium]